MEQLSAANPNTETKGNKMSQLKKLLVKEIPKAIEVMSSLQVVDLINHKRGLDGGQAVLAHSDFMKKVPQVLGQEGLGNFSSSYFNSQNKPQPCYRQFLFTAKGINWIADKINA